MNYKIKETFSITMGTVIVVESFLEFTLGQTISIQILCPNGTAHTAQATPEYMLRNNLEIQVYVLKNKKLQIPEDSTIEFLK